MVSNVTSLTGNGLKDWLIQRVTSVYLLLYAAYLAFFFAKNPDLEYEAWRLLFQCTVFKIATVVVLFALSFHAWIGLWTVTTDYLKNTAIRLSVQMGLLTWILFQLVYGLFMIWGR